MESGLALRSMPPLAYAVHNPAAKRLRLFGHISRALEVGYVFIRHVTIYMDSVTRPQVTQDIA